MNEFDKQDRIKKIKEGLNSDIYSKLDEIEHYPETDVSPTSKLANILDGYLTKVDNLNIDEDIKELKILDDQEVEVEVDETDILREYNNKIHDFETEDLEDLEELNNSLQSKDKGGFDIDEATQEVEELIKSLDDLIPNNLEQMEIDPDELKESETYGILEDKYPLEQEIAISVDEEALENIDVELTQNLIANDALKDFDLEEQEFDQEDSELAKALDEEVVNPTSRRRRSKASEVVEEESVDNIEEEEENKGSKLDIILIIVLVLICIAFAYIVYTSGILNGVFSN